MSDGIREHWLAVGRAEARVLYDRQQVAQYERDAREAWALQDPGCRDRLRFVSDSSGSYAASLLVR